MRMFSRYSTPYAARAAVIAAVYACLTLIWPFSYGPIQVRVSEALTVLPIFCASAAPGLFVGCLLSGILAGAPWFDVVFGSLATLIAAMITRRLRGRPAVSMLAPVALNALIVGPVVHFAYAGNPALSFLPVNMLAVGAGEFIACYALGLPLCAALRRLPARVWQ